jgi:hypothetical protein
MMTTTTAWSCFSSEQVPSLPRLWAVNHSMHAAQKIQLRRLQTSSDLGWKQTRLGVCGRDPIEVGDHHHRPAWGETPETFNSYSFGSWVRLSVGVCTAQHRSEEMFSVLVDGIFGGPVKFQWLHPYSTSTVAHHHQTRQRDGTFVFQLPGNPDNR